MKLDISSLEKAINSLNAALEEYKIQQNDFLRDSCIQRFEYTYELSWKMLKRYLEMSEPASNTIDELSFPGLIRKANERGLLLSDWTQWKVFREARNATSHAYNENKAEDVFSIIPDFYDESLFLFNKLQERLSIE